MFRSGSTLIAVMGLFLAVFPATRAEAIPAFSREYKTECTTCHTIFPQLNEFGQAFEKNAFVWPGASKKKPAAPQTEQERKSAEYIILSGLPKEIPVSFLTSVSYLYDDTKEDTFDQKRFSAQILTAGAFGDKIGFWFNESLGNQNTTATNSLTGPSQLYFVARDPFKIPVHFKAGKFSPDLSLWKASLNGSLLSTSYSDGFSVTGSQNGVELMSIFGSRVQAVVGVNDRNNSSDAKAPHSVNDFYGRLGVKFGGSDYHGVEPDVDLDKDSVWDFLSVSFSGFGYSGSTSKGDGVDHDVNRYGVESEVAYKKILLMAGYSVGDNEQSATTTVDSNAWSVEADYILSQKWAFTLRYDSVEVDGKEDREVIAPSITWAPLQNFKFRLSYASDSNPTSADKGKAVETDAVTITASMSF
jgi:hypothetical protein